MRFLFVASIVFLAVSANADPQSPCGNGNPTDLCPGGGDGGNPVSVTVDNSSSSVAGAAATVINEINVESPGGGFFPTVIGGDTTDVGVLVEGDTFEASDVATPASMFTDLCTSGANASGQGWTASLGSGSRFCRHVKLAETALAAGNVDKANYHMAQAESLLYRNGFVCKWLLLDFVPVVNFVLCP